MNGWRYWTGLAVLGAALGLGAAALFPDVVAQAGRELTKPMVENQDFTILGKWTMQDNKFYFDQTAVTGTNNFANPLRHTLVVPRMAGTYADPNGYLADTYPRLAFVRADGTYAAPEAVVQNQILGSLEFHGVYQDSFWNKNGWGAMIQSMATGDWTGSNTEANLRFYTVQPGVTQRLRLEIPSTGPPLNTVLVGDDTGGGGALQFQYKAIPDCDAANEALNFDTDDTAFSCQSIAGGGGSPGGADTQVQYNNSGAFGGDADFTFDGTDVTVGNDLIIGDGSGGDALLFADQLAPSCLASTRAIYWSTSQFLVCEEGTERSLESTSTTGGTGGVQFASASGGHESESDFVYTTGSNTLNLDTLTADDRVKVGDAAGGDYLDFSDQTLMPTCSGSNRRIWWNGTTNKFVACEEGTTTNIIGTSPVLPLGTEAQGDILFYGSLAYQLLTAGIDGLQLETNGGGANPSWEWPSRKLESCAIGGSAILAGTPVYFSAWNANGLSEVGIADADDPSKMPAVGVAGSTIDTTCNAGDSDWVAMSAVVAGLDTSSFAEKDALYVSAHGACTGTYTDCWTTTAPTGEATAIQKVAQVSRDNAGNGSLVVFGAGRSNATPNLDDDAIFLGNSSNQAVTADLPDCDGTGDVIQYDTTTNAFSCVSEPSTEYNSLQFGESTPEGTGHSAVAGECMQWRTPIAIKTIFGEFMYETVAADGDAGDGFGIAVYSLDGNTQIAEGIDCGAGSCAPSGCRCDIDGGGTATLERGEYIVAVCSDSSSLPPTMGSTSRLLRKTGTGRSSCTCTGGDPPDTITPVSETAVLNGRTPVIVVGP